MKAASYFVMMHTHLKWCHRTGPCWHRWSYHLLCEPRTTKGLPSCIWKKKTLEEVEQNSKLDCCGFDLAQELQIAIAIKGKLLWPSKKWTKYPFMGGLMDWNKIQTANKEMKLFWICDEIFSTYVENGNHLQLWRCKVELSLRIVVKRSNVYLPNDYWAKYVDIK